MYNSFLGLHIITSQYMVDYYERWATHHFKPGQRRGKNQSPTKRIYLGSYSTPSNDFFLDQSRGMMICHPALEHQLWELLHDTNRT